MELIYEMRKRHEREIAELQAICTHGETHKSGYMWAPGHFGNDVEVCDWCGKILRYYDSNVASLSNKTGS